MKLTYSHFPDTTRTALNERLGMELMLRSPKYCGMITEANVPVQLYLKHYQMLVRIHAKIIAFHDTK